jgi:putative protein-disulfide isomerase
MFAPTLPPPGLIYFADPMCSWCWGFAPVIAEVAVRFGETLPIRLVMGGLRPGTETPMTPQGWAEIGGHWRHVEAASGQPFKWDILAREGFVYDTDPAARAVVLMRKLSPDRALGYLLAIQQAFYADNLDVTSLEVLADLAAQLGAQRAPFRQGLEDPALKDETWADYGVSQRAGVSGFPTLVGGPNEAGAYGVITRGFQPADLILPLLDRWMAARDVEQTAELNG